MIKIPKDVDIQPGQAFHLPAAQQKNLSTLLGVLSKREATKAITAMGETTPEAWEDIENTVGNLKEIIVLGGSSEILQSFGDQVKTTLETAIEGALSPITNTIDNIVGTALEPAFEWLQDLSNDISTFIAGNETGAFFGAMIGSIWGPMTTLIGGIVGAAVEALIEFFIDYWGKKPSDVYEDLTGDDIWELVFPPDPEDGEMD